MSKGMYARFLAARQRSHKSLNVTQVKLPDQTGEETPVKLTLKGVCDNTNESIAQLIESQGDTKLGSKQTAAPVEETGEVRVEKRTWDKMELATAVRLRKKIAEAIKSNTLEAFIAAEELATAEYEKQVKTSLAELQKNPAIIPQSEPEPSTIPQERGKKGAAVAPNGQK